MPVVTPSFASIETVNAVPCRAVLSGAIGARSSSSSLSPVMARQISPRPWVAMKLMASGVTSSAAIVRSPSFSRSSSSNDDDHAPGLQFAHGGLDGRKLELVWRVIRIPRVFMLTQAQACPIFSFAASCSAVAVAVASSPVRHDSGHKPELCGPRRAEGCPSRNNSLARMCPAHAGIE